MSAWNYHWEISNKCDYSILPVTDIKLSIGLCWRLFNHLVSFTASGQWPYYMMLCGFLTHSYIFCSIYNGSLANFYNKTSINEMNITSIRIFFTWVNFGCVEFPFDLMFDIIVKCFHIYFFDKRQGIVNISIEYSVHPIPFASDTS